MKTALFGWLFGFGLLISHVGCCSVRFVGDGCGMGACGDVDCEVGGCGSLRSRIANRIRNTHCSSGCGEIYWDEHINEPPVCDPCGCNGEFECGSCSSCPTALGRLKNLWGYRYMPSSCGECNSCGLTSNHGGSSSCATCASNTQSSYSSNDHMSSHSEMMSSEPIENSVIKRSPTPAKPKQAPAPSVIPKPTPDTNAMHMDEDSTERLVIGSGTSKARKMTTARPVSTSLKPSGQGKPRLVTNPR